MPCLCLHTFHLTLAGTGPLKSDHFYDSKFQDGGVPLHIPSLAIGNSRTKRFICPKITEGCRIFLSNLRRCFDNTELNLGLFIN